MRNALFALAAAAIAVFVSCGGGSYRSGEPSQVPEYRVYSSGERECKYCNIHVFGGHICGRTVPCAHCKREHGAFHLHEISRVCPPCNWTHYEVHVCNDSKDCGPCRKDGRKSVGEKGCDRCYRMMQGTTVHGITAYCAPCNNEVGTNHICGKTRMCITCVREAGDGHAHDATRLCSECKREVSLDHEHGATTYCKECHRDAGAGHRHGQTIWCILCTAEKDWPHTVHTDY